MHQCHSLGDRERRAAGGEYHRERILRGHVEELSTEVEAVGEVGAGWDVHHRGEVAGDTGSKVDVAVVGPLVHERHHVIDSEVGINKERRQISHDDPGNAARNRGIPVPGLESTGELLSVMSSPGIRWGGKRHSGRHFRPAEWVTAFPVTVS